MLQSYKTQNNKVKGENKHGKYQDIQRMKCDWKSRDLTLKINTCKCHCKRSFQHVIALTRHDNNNINNNKRKDLMKSKCVTKRQSSVSVFFSYSRYSNITLLQWSSPLLKLNASTHIEPLQDNKVSTGESLTSFTLSHKLPALGVNTKLPSTPQGLFFTFSTNTSIFCSLFFFSKQSLTWQKMWTFGLCKFDVSRGLVCRRQYPGIGSSSTLAYVWSEMNSHSVKWILKIRGVLSHITKHSLKKYSSKLFSCVFLRLIWNSRLY